MHSERLRKKETNRRKRKMANDQFEIFIQMLYDTFEEYKIERGGE
jgi:hypothetical protein